MKLFLFEIDLLDDRCLERSVVETGLYGCQFVKDFKSFGHISEGRIVSIQETAILMTDEEL